MYMCVHVYVQYANISYTKLNTALYIHEAGTRWHTHCYNLVYYNYHVCACYIFHPGPQSAIFVRESIYVTLSYILSYIDSKISALQYSTSDCELIYGVVDICREIIIWLTTQYKHDIQILHSTYESATGLILS